MFLYISFCVTVFIFFTSWNTDCLPQIFIRIWGNIFSDLQVFPLSPLEYSVFWNVWNLASSEDSESKIFKSIWVCMPHKKKLWNSLLFYFQSECSTPSMYFLSTSSEVYNFSDKMNILNILFCPKKLLNSELLHTSISGDNRNFCLLYCFLYFQSKENCIFFGYPLCLQKN